MITIKISEIEITITDGDTECSFKDLATFKNNIRHDIETGLKNPIIDTKKVEGRLIKPKNKIGGFKPKITINDTPKQQKSAVYSKKYSLKKSGQLTPEKEAELDKMLDDIKARENSYQISD